MARRLVALSAILLLAASSWAGDPWKDKTYKQWDEKDVRKIMSDSPWAREVRVPANWKGGGGGSGGSGRNAPAGGTDYGEKNAGNGPDTGVASKMSGMEQESANEAAFVVQWASARTMREARARSAMLRGMSEADADKQLAPTPEQYIVIILGRDMTPFAKSSEDSLKSKTRLKLKKNKGELTPVKVEIMRAKEGPGVQAVLFYFERKNAGGEATIAADEKGVEFVVEATRTTLKTSFDLTKMAVQPVDL